MAEVVAREVVVRGRVQGVFFRATCRRTAQEHGVAGWALNEPDGSVRAVFEGSPEAVEALVDWCRHGPPHASIESIDVQERPPESLGGFDVG